MEVSLYFPRKLICQSRPRILRSISSEHLSPRLQLVNSGYLTAHFLLAFSLTISKAQQLRPESIYLISRVHVSILNLLLILVEPSLYQSNSIDLLLPKTHPHQKRQLGHILTAEQIRRTQTAPSIGLNSNQLAKWQVIEEGAGWRHLVDNPRRSLGATHFVETLVSPDSFAILKMHVLAEPAKVKPVPDWACKDVHKMSPVHHDSAPIRACKEQFHSSPKIPASLQ